MTTVCIVWDGRLWGSNLILHPALRFSFNNPWLLGQALFTHSGYQSSNSFLKITLFSVSLQRRFSHIFGSGKLTFAPATPSPLNPLVPSIHPFTSILHLVLCPLTLYDLELLVFLPQPQCLKGPGVQPCLSSTRGSSYTPGFLRKAY